MEQKVKKKITFRKVLSIITDVLIYPIIVLSVLSSFVMLNSKRDNEVYSIFGVSVVKILSGSMMASGFEKDDLVILYRAKTDDLRVGDDIAFYRFKDPDDPYASKLVRIPDDFSSIPEITSKESVVGTKTKKDAAKAECPVIFHRIIAIYQAADGTRFFQTQGTSNPGPDATFVREDFVVGRDIGTPEWVNQVLKFCSSPKGMICLVILPLSILIFFQLLEIFEIINQLLLEKKVLAMDVRYDYADCYKNNIGFEMRYFDQIYFYDAVPVIDKKPVKDFLWGNLYNSTKRKEIKKLAVVNNALDLYKESADKYWNYIIENAKYPKTKRKLQKNYNLAKTIKIGQDKNNAIENYEKLKESEDFIKAEQAKDKKELKKNKKEKGKKNNKLSDTEIILSELSKDKEKQAKTEVVENKVSTVKTDFAQSKNVNQTTVNNNIGQNQTNGSKPKQNNLSKPKQIKIDVGVNKNGQKQPKQNTNEKPKQVGKPQPKFDGKSDKIIDKNVKQIKPVQNNETVPNEQKTINKLPQKTLVEQKTDKASQVNKPPQKPSAPPKKK